MENIKKYYPEFDFTVTYNVNNEDKEISWEVIQSHEGDLLMTGKFISKDFYRSKFNLIPSNIEENMYESLFYLYFENIKVECIELIEDKNIEDIEELY